MGRLVVRNRGRTAAGGLGRHPRSSIGSGVFGDLARKVFSGGFKKLISVAHQAGIPQKIADLAVNGARSAGEHLGRKAGRKLGDVVARNKVLKKIAAPIIAAPAQKKKKKKPPSQSRGASQHPRNRSSGKKRPRQQSSSTRGGKRSRYDRLINHRGSGIVLE